MGLIGALFSEGAERWVEGDIVIKNDPHNPKNSTKISREYPIIAVGALMFLSSLGIFVSGALERVEGADLHHIKAYVGECYDRLEAVDVLLPVLANDIGVMSRLEGVLEVDLLADCPDVVEVAAADEQSASTAQNSG
jgi:hypothetical protein